MKRRKTGGGPVPVLAGASNPNWKGGRVVASNGYVLVRVGVGHHLADVRGYAYEHRIVVEQVLGRRLLPDEEVHHRDGNKQNNAFGNLEVMTASQHRAEHRTSGRQLRLPGEENRVIECGCGCGKWLKRFDEQGRPRAYLSGHNPRTSPVADAVLAAMDTGLRKVALLAEHIQKPRTAVTAALGKLEKANKVRRVRHGEWVRNG